MALTEHQKSKEFLLLERIRMKYDALFFNELRRFFREELILLLTLSEFGEKRINQTLDNRKQRLAFLLTPLYNSCALEFYTYQISQKSMQQVVTVTSEAIDYRVDKIIESTKGYVSQAFLSGVNTKDKINAIYANNGRVMTIANTEVNTASNIGLYNGALARGKKEKIWICSRREGVREGHKLIDGQRKPISERFSNGLLYPGEYSASPSQTVNCRCFQLFV